MFDCLFTSYHRMVPVHYIIRPNKIMIVAKFIIVIIIIIIGRERVIVVINRTISFVLVR
jgi:hypothetical protein